MEVPAAYRVAVLAGDGIGPEVMEASPLVLEAAGRRFGFRLDLVEADVGGAAIEEAVRGAIASGLRTRDIAGGGPSVGTREMAEKIAAAI
jgi:isocitrate/isopropylmalate dehydrogenase